MLATLLSQPEVWATSWVELFGIVTIIGLIWGAYSHIECHHEGCHRRGKFPYGPYKFCRVHHPNVPSDGKINQEHIDAVKQGERMATIDPKFDPGIQAGVDEVAKDAPGLVRDIQAGDFTGAVAAGTAAEEALAPLIPTIIQETKAGYKTTEFWALIVWEVVSESEVFFHLPGTWGKLVAGLGALAAYVLSRGIAKNGVPHQVVVKP